MKRIILISFFLLSNIFLVNSAHAGIWAITSNAFKQTLKYTIPITKLASGTVCAYIATSKYFFLKELAATAIKNGAKSPSPLIISDWCNALVTAIVAGLAIDSALKDIREIRVKNTHA